MGGHVPGFGSKVACNTRLMIEEFLRAASEGDLAVLSMHPELVNIRYQGSAALHHAAIHGQMEAALWLLEHGALLDTRDDELGMTPAAWANEKGQKEMVDFLLSQGALITPFEAAAFGKLDRLQAFIATDPTVLDEEREFGTVLHAACIWGHGDIVDWLISHGADMTRRSPQGLTPLEIIENQAADGRHTPLVTGERRAEIQRSCAAIANRLRQVLNAV